MTDKTDNPIMCTSNQLESATKDIVFICAKCGYKTMGGKGLAEWLEWHEGICSGLNFNFILPTDTRYEDIRKQMKEN